MADQRNKIITTIEVDTTNAQNEITALNEKASDSTQTYEKRLEAKNKVVKIQNDLSNKIISSLEKEVDRVRKLEGETANLISLEKKLLKAREDAEKVADENADAQEKLAESLKKSKTATEKLDDATGGLISKFKAFATNPIGLVVIALAGAFKLVSEAIGRSESASESFGKIGAKLSGFFNGLIAVITPVVELFGEALVFAIEKPEEAWQSFVDTLESGWNFISGQIIDRFQANWTILSGVFQAGVLKMRIAWNNFTNDSEEADKLTKELDQVNKSIAEATETIKEKNQEIINLANDAVDAIVNFAVEAEKNYDKAAEASERLVNSERALVFNRIALEKQQLTSLRLAEEQRQIRDDESKSIEERIQANAMLGKILDEQLKKEEALAMQALGLANLQANASGRTIENIEAIGDAEIKLLEIRERITGQRSEQIVNEQSLLKEDREIKNAIALKELEDQNKIDQIKIDRLKSNGQNTLDEELALLERKKEQELANFELTEIGKKEIEERFKLEKEELEKADEEKRAEIEFNKREKLLELEELEIERLREKDELTLNRELEFLEKRRAQEVSAANLTAEDILLINTKFEDAKSKLNEAEKKASKAKEDAVLDNALNGAAEAFGIAQEVAVARMIMEAPQAIAGSFKNAATAYAPPLAQIMGALGAATTVVPIIKGLADIKKTRFPGKKGGGGTAGGGASIAAPAKAGAGASAPTITPEIVSDIASNNSARLGIDSGLGDNASATAANNVTGGAQANIVFSESRYQEFRNQVGFKEEQVVIE